MIFELSAPTHSYLDFFLKIIHFYWLNTEKHRFLYDRISLEPCYYDFWIQSKTKKESSFSKKIQHFRKYLESRIFSRISTFYENINYFRKSELISKKLTFDGKVNFFRNIQIFRKNNIFLCCSTEFVTIKARRTAIPVLNAFYAKSWRQSSPQTPQTNK